MRERSCCGIPPRYKKRYETERCSFRCFFVSALVSVAVRVDALYHRYVSRFLTLWRPYLHALLFVTATTGASLCERAVCVLCAVCAYLGRAVPSRIQRHCRFQSTLLILELKKKNKHTAAAAAAAVHTTSETHIGSYPSERLCSPFSTYDTLGISRQPHPEGESCMNTRYNIYMLSIRVCMTGRSGFHVLVRTVQHAR